VLRALREVEEEERRMYGDKYEEKRNGIRFYYRLPDGRKVRGDLVEGEDRIMAILYADDLVFLSEDQDFLRRLVMSFESVCH